MRRDWDCIRAVLLALEAKGDTASVVRAGEVVGYDAETVSYHMQLMIQAGLIDGHCVQPTSSALQCHARSMTWAGHELLDQIRSEGVWNRVKTVAREQGLSLSLDLVKTLAKRAIEALVG